MNIFFISPGRTGTTSISLAFECIDGFTSAHESRVNLLGRERINYPTEHFECDNRLIWFMPRLTEKYSHTGILVIVNRDHKEIATSYNRRWGGLGIMRAYAQGILMRPIKNNGLEVCEDYVENAYEQLNFAKKEWDNVIDLDLDHPEKGVQNILTKLNRVSNLERILSSLKTVKANKNNKTLRVKTKHFIQNSQMLFEDLIN